MFGVKFAVPCQATSWQHDSSEGTTQNQQVLNTSLLIRAAPVASPLFIITVDLLARVLTGAGTSLSRRHHRHTAI